MKNKTMNSIYFIPKITKFYNSLNITKTWKVVF